MTDINERHLIDRKFIKRKQKNYPWIFFEREQAGVEYRFILGEKYPESNPNCGVMTLHSPEDEIFAPTEEDLERTMIDPEYTVSFAWNIKHVEKLDMLLEVLFPNRTS